MFTIKLMMVTLFLYFSIMVFIQIIPIIFDTKSIDLSIHPVLIITLMIWSSSLPLCTVFTFSLICLGLQVRFKKLNEILTQNQDLKAISSLHLMLVEIIRLVNEIYALPLTFCVLSSLMQTTSSAYDTFEMLISIRNEFNRHRFAFSLVTSAWDAFVVTHFVASVVAPTIAVREAEKGFEICCKMRKRMRSAVNLELLMLQLSHTKEIKFSCGLYAYDWSLVFNFFTAMMSYLIIFIQFDASLISKALSK
jgi:hypothetical protein